MSGAFSSISEFEPARPQQRRIDPVQPVGRGEHEDAFQLLDAIKLGQQLRNDALAYLAGGSAATLGRQRVDLVEKDDGWSGQARLAKHLADRALAFARPHADELRPLDRDEIGLRLAGDGLGQQGLAHARPAMQQMPREGRTPAAANSSRCWIGQSTASDRSAFTSSRPPTSPQCTSGTSTEISRRAEG